MNFNTIYRKLAKVNHHSNQVAVKVTKNGNYLAKVGPFFEAYITPDGEILHVENVAPRHYDGQSQWEWLDSMGVETSFIDITLPTIAECRKAWRNQVYHEETVYSNEYGTMYKYEYFYKNHGPATMVKILCNNCN